MKRYRSAGPGELPQTFDCGAWHTECSGVEVLATNGRFYLWCGMCRCLAEVEAVARRIAANDSHYAREKLEVQGELK